MTKENRRMSNRHGGAFASVLLAALLALGCKFSGGLNNSNTPSANTGANTSNAPASNTSAQPSKNATSADSEGVISSGTGTEKEKPSAGKANVQGRVLYDGQPAKGIEVKLCEKFERYISGCGGETFKTKTDDAGEYLFKDVPPRIYEGLIAKVFNTDYYVFATSGIVQTAKYKVEEDKTFFAPDTNLFKSDLKLQSPKAGSKIAPDNIEVKWDAYPDAAYYKLNIYADTSTGATPNYDYINKRVDGLSYTLDKPLGPGSYRVEVNAYNADDVKLSESPDDIKFTVTGGASK
jgi:hypothetical protein